MSFVRPIGDSLALAAGKEALRIGGVSKAFHGTVAVDNVTLTVPEGAFLSLLGPSGSGKTTLLMLIAGFEQPDSGTIELGARDLVGMPPERRNFGMVFQGYALFPHMTVAENIAFPLRVRHVDRAEQKQRVARALDLVKLQGYEDRRPGQISGGQQQRVALARALIFEPDILLLDEPLSALDKKLRAGLQVELRELQRRIGKTFLCVTHDQEEALSMSDEIAILRDGRLVQAGTPQDLFEHPRSHFVADFLGESNVIEGEIIRRDGDSIAYKAGGLIFHQSAASKPPSSSILLALRPARLKIGKADPGEGNRLHGVVAACQYRGNELQCQVDTALGHLAALQPTWQSDYVPGIGQSVWLSWEANAAQIVLDDRRK
jgi:putative spermidine/putrescine transport system ATP-binding protein